MMTNTLTRSLTLAVTLFGANTAQAQIGCDRACLTGFVDAWFAGLHANTTRGVPLANGVRISQNGMLVGLQGSFWDSAEETVYRWDIANTRLGDTGTEAIVRNSNGSNTSASSRPRQPAGAAAFPDRTPTMALPLGLLREQNDRLAQLKPA